MAHQSPPPTSHKDASSVSIRLGDRKDLGYQMYDAIMKNDLNTCWAILDAEYPVNGLLRYTFSVEDESDSDPESNEFLTTTIHVACIYRRFEIVELLLRNGARTEVIDRYGRTPLIITIMYWPRIYRLNKHLAYSREEVEYHEYLRQLHLNSFHCMEVLCKHGADVNFPYGVFKETPLHLASRYHVPSCVEILLKYGANVNIQDVNGRTPLHHLCIRGSRTQDGLEIIRLLFEFEIEINRTDNGGNTALHLAASNGCNSFVELLLRLGANPNLKNNSGIIPLYLLLDDIRNVCCSSTLSILIGETTYLHIRNENQQLPALLLHPNKQKLHNIVMERTKQVPSLLQLCRHAIRLRIGINNLSKIEELCCPKALHDFIQLPNFYDVSFND